MQRSSRATAPKSLKRIAAPAVPRAPRRRVAIGPPRPQYLLNEESDRMMMIITALAAEVSALRDRLDTHEALGERRRFATRKSVDQYRLTAQRQADRESQRQQLLARVYRILMEDLDEVRQGESLQARQLLESEVAAA
jgi:hypothetical protein